MKTRYLLLAFVALSTFFLTPGLLRAQDNPNDDQGASFQTFYDQLSDQGTWIQTDDYGYVFQPAVTDPNWAPYTEGHWVYTPEGWAWVSDESWGWATYHYGRWANIDGMGWVWVPGYRWAPAWVSWRYGGGYAGWAPLPPETFVGVEFGDPGFNGGGGFHFGGDVDVSFHIGAGEYNFVHVADLGNNNYRGRYVNRSSNFGIINNTTNVTNINVGNGPAGANFAGVTAGGPSINKVNALARQHIATDSLTAASQPGRSTLQGNTLVVYAPRVNPASVHQAKPAVVGQTIHHPTFNRGDSITRPLAVTASVSPAPPSAAAIQAARQAQAHVPAHAQIATEATPIRPVLTKPLTSMEPVPQVHQPAQVQPNIGVTNPNVQHQAVPPAPQPQAQHEEDVRAQQEAAHQQQVQDQQVRAQQESQPQAQVQHQPQAQPQPQAQAQHQQAQAQQPQAKGAGQGAADDKKKLPGQ